MSFLGEDYGNYVDAAGRNLESSQQLEYLFTNPGASGHFQQSRVADHNVTRTDSSFYGSPLIRHPANNFTAARYTDVLPDASVYHDQEDSEFHNNDLPPRYSLDTQVRIFADSDPLYYPI